MFTFVCRLKMFQPCHQYVEKKKLKMLKKNTLKEISKESLTYHQYWNIFLGYFFLYHQNCKLHKLSIEYQALILQE